VEPVTSAAKAAGNKAFIAALKRCAAQNHGTHGVIADDCPTLQTIVAALSSGWQTAVAR
jgi:hypothetical protein